ncbi:Rho-GTPase-activating protein 8 [Dimargaris verticillata]|uniref:Rho-GTPase-activating protein 8 n=1 Tax=Dimargaris verticillata TaxID=2761393 RepID=A0A9W8B6Q6_9FUNG|nr:Rho-GTPase-activating protein 8 [Dimargaris verticillata]
MLKFENCFWGNVSHGTEYQPGVEPLQQRLNQGLVELEEVLDFFTERIAAEQAYARRLQALGERAPRLDGFRRDDGASLRMVFEALQREQLAECQVHQRFVQDMLDRVIEPLKSFYNAHQNRLATNHRAINQEIAQHRGLCQHTEKLGRLYRAHCTRAEFAQQSNDQRRTTTFAAHRQIQVISHVLGKLSFTRGEFSQFLEQAQTELPAHSIKFGLLGVFKGLVLGQDLVRWLLTRYPKELCTMADAEAVGQSLIGQGYLRRMGRGQTFTVAEAAYYQWRSAARNHLLAPEHGEGAVEDRSPVSLLANVLSKVHPLIDELEDADYSKRRPSLDSFEYDENSALAAVQREQHQATQAETQYKAAVRQADHVRMALEEQLESYLETMQVWETERLLHLQSSFGHFTQLLSPQSNPYPQQRHDRLVVACESFKPDQDIQYIMEQYGTGGFCPRPIVFTHHSRGTGDDQIFGVPLADQMRPLCSRPVPPFVWKCLSALRKGMAELSDHDKRVIWTMETSLSSVHALRYEVNHASRVTLKQLRMFDLTIIVGGLCLYLLELPECLCTFELYDAVKTLYPTHHDTVHSEKKVAAIRALLQGLPPIHITTLQALVEPLRQLVTTAGDSPSESDSVHADLVQRLYQRFGPLILRPRAGSHVNFHDKHPARFMADLIHHHDQIFHQLQSAIAMPKTRSAPKPGMTDGGPALPNRPSRANGVRVGQAALSANLQGLLSPTYTFRGSEHPGEPRLRPLQRQATAPTLTKLMPLHRTDSVTSQASASSEADHASEPLRSVTGLLAHQSSSSSSSLDQPLHMAAMPKPSINGANAGVKSQFMGQPPTPEQDDELSDITALVTQSYDSGQDMADTRRNQKVTMSRPASLSHAEQELSAVTRIMEDLPEFRRKPEGINNDDFDAFFDE